MSRKEMYAYIKKHNLQSKVAEVTGDNYTRASNNVLDKVIIQHMHDNTTVITEEVDVEILPQNSVEIAGTETKTTVINLDNEDPVKSALIVALSYLKQVGVLDDVLKEVK